jgi:hypothetical protein
MWRNAVGILLMVAMATSATASNAKPRKPKLTIRTTPQMAFAPANVLFTAQLADAESHEELYCPGVQWEWGDGETSFHEYDCPPFGPSVEFENRFSGRHAYGRGGVYEVRVSLVRAGRTIAASQATLTVYSRAGSLGDVR